jgi:class 3 adenylate cyclase/tetratricopeptide (TPR) repeat protein
MGCEARLTPPKIAMPTNRVFLSYRREDSAGHAGRLFDALVDAFGKDSVFMDIDTITPGQDFAKAIDSALLMCDDSLVVIGPRWLRLSERGERLQLDGTEDFVRLEIERSLLRNVRVLPILVGGAVMPSSRDLPSSIEALAHRQAFQLSDHRWHADVNELITLLRTRPQRAQMASATTGADRREERKVVSVLVCDLVGFTAASGRVDPEDVRARRRPYHHQLRQVIEGHGGTVENFAGEAVMAVFGAPLAHEDDAERAVRAGLRILEALEDLNHADERLQLQVRVGINTGEAVVVVGAQPEHGESLITGDVVNTAYRLQGVAPVNGVAVSEVTYRQTERLFDFVRLEPARVQGEAEPLAVWQPLAARARIGADVIRSHSTPLVGRELERSLLIAAFERVAKQRVCQLVTLVGEPGVGKTRLCTELLQYVEGWPGLVRWRQGRSLPYGEGIAFWALGEIVKAHCGILESDSPDMAGAKLDDAIPRDEPDRAWLQARLAPLVGAGGEPAAQEESFTAWRRFLEGLAAQDTAVLVFEDLHWADDSMLAFLEHLADWSEGVPLLLLCTTRPELFEQHPTWAAGLRNAQTINLAPLSDEETATLLALLLQRAVLPAGAQQALLERAGGNPLYAEEFVSLLGDRNLLAGPLEQVPIPDSLQALIAARLDTLSAERKSLLQDAAVVGKVFWAGALSAMGNRDLRDVQQALHDLARKELVRPARISSMQGEREYGFWHVLVRDVCYAQIPRTSRAARHRSAAAWIEERAGERVDDLADVLAHHYLQSLQLSRASGQEHDIPELESAARRNLRLAGERALPIDVDSAEVSFARALELAPAGHPERAELLERWAQAARQQGRLTEATAALDEALGLYREPGATVSAARALVSIANVLVLAGDPRREKAAIAEALAILDAEEPGPELVMAYAQLAGAHARGAAFTEAIAAAERALQLAVELGLPEPADALGQRGAARAYLGNQQGLDDMRRALALAIQQGRGRDAAVLYNNLALVSWEYEGPLAALDLCREGIAFSERRGIAEVALFIAVMRLTLLAASGRSDEALADAHPVAELGKAVKDAATVIEARSVRLGLLGERGEEAMGSAVADLVTSARDTAQPQMMAMAFAAAAKIMLARGQSTQAKRLLRELEQTGGARADPYYAAFLPQLVRCALALRDPELAARLTEGVEPRTPLQQHALAASGAALAEARAHHGEAAAAYDAAATAWRVFGDVPECAYALLGQGRCLVALGGAGGDGPLREAGARFTAMGYVPARMETEALLSQRPPAS